MRRRGLVLAVMLLLASAPAGVATHQNVAVPPHATGMGANDVRDEPNHGGDANGFPHVGFRPVSEALVLDSYYVFNVQQADVAVNELVNVAVHGDDVDSYEHVILPGRGHFKAWWGWWQDTGSGGHLQEQGLGGGPDGRIDDAHDDTGAYDDPRNGPWDELVWRGDNPWANDHGHVSYPEDRMFLFLQPGTFTPWNPLVEPAAGTGLADGADAAEVPDAGYRDNTDLAAYSPRPVEQRQGWVAADGVGFTFTDASLLVAVEATTAVNPDPLADGGYDASKATARDVDRYTAAHPLVEELYRTAVWDPGDEVDGPVDAVHEEGAKGEARWAYNGGAQSVVENTTQPVQRMVKDAFEPAWDAAGPVLGAGEDPARPPYRHEPNHPDDAYNGHASYDPATTYDGLDGTYYEPGANQSYDGYGDEAHVWLDAHVGAGSTLDAFIFNVPTRTGARPADGAPQALYLTARWGTWFDEDGDTWVGTAEDDPYQHGFRSDPNDYGSSEFRGLCKGTLAATLVPDTPRERWGNTGVYVVRDAGGGFNPYDDAAADLTGTTPAWQDGDGETLSRYVVQGPVDATLRWCEQPWGEAGSWKSDTTLVLPAGSVEVPVRVTTTGHVDRVEDTRPNGDTLLDVTVRDVDVLQAP